MTENVDASTNTDEYTCMKTSTVSMTIEGNELPAGLDATIKGIYKYWQSKRVENQLPLRSDIDPVEIPSYLSRIVLVDVEGEDNQGKGIFRYRLLGTEEINNRNQNPTGQLVNDGYFSESMDIALRSYDNIRRKKKPHFERRKFISNRNIVIFEECILMPLSRNGHDVSQILGYAVRVRNPSQDFLDSFGE